MQITFSPTRHACTLKVHRIGDQLTLNGEDFDFSALPNGATLPQAAIASDWIAGDVTRLDGTLHIVLVLPHGANAPRETRFAEPITLTEDGAVTLPVYDIPKDIEEDRT